MEPSDVLDENGNLSIKLGKNVSRRDVMKQLGAVGAAMGMAGMAGCGQGGGTDTPTSGGGNGTGTPGSGSQVEFEFSKHPAWAPPGWSKTQTESGTGMNERKAVFVLQNTDNPFFIPMTVGFNDALNVFGWTGGVRGPGQGGTLQEQVNIIQDAISNMSEGDVLVTTILNTNLYNSAIQDALDKNIAVVNGHSTPATNKPGQGMDNAWTYETQQDQFTYTSPVTGNDRPMIIPHVGIRDARGGVAMAKEMYERLQASGNHSAPYRVFLVNDLPDNPSVTRRVSADAASEGTAQRYFNAQSDVEVYQDKVFTTPQPPKVGESRNFVVENVSGNDIDAVVCSAFWAASGTAAAIRNGEISGDTLACGFDLVGLTGTGESAPLTQGGGLTFTVYQDPYSQGFQNVPLAWMWLERGIEMKDLEWGVSVYDERNIKFATQRRKWTTLFDWQKQSDKMSDNLTTY